MKNSRTYYNHLANEYIKQSSSRIAYLNAIDEIIIKMTKNNISNYLDIGCGDGRRSLKISSEIGVTDNIILVDDSNKMLNKLNESDKIQVNNSSIFDFSSPIKFNLITCLWNVLGHFPSKDLRIQFFKKIDELLDANGILIFDVNNRYNISHYGYNNVAGNLQRDFLKEIDSGWFTLGSENNKTNVYIHSPFDITEYIAETNLRLESTKFIDYSTGEEKETFFEGQLLYKIIKS